MAENTADDLNLAAAQAAGRLLERCVPEHVAVLTPYVLRLFAALQNGHSFVWLDEGEAEELAGLAPAVGQGASPLVLQGRKLFLGRMWQLEYDLAAEIKRLAEAEVEPVDWMSASQNLSCWFADKGSEGQRDAAGLALLQTFMLITGGPGTGKTTTVAKLLGLICTNSVTRPPRIALAAPTGKAAAHMARALHRAVDGFEMSDAVRNHLSALEGQTVHRLLKLRPPQMLPAFDGNRPLPLDVLVVDEASMLDVSLLLHLLRAIPSGCRVIFLGDEFQLPSVGVGAVLAALSRRTVLDKETAEQLSIYLPEHGFPVEENPPALSQNVAQLTVSHRFGADSGIGCLARAVVSGKSAEGWAQFALFPDELEIREGRLKQQAELLYRKHEKYWQAVDKNDVALAFGHAADVVVLAAWRQDAEAFNEEYCRYLQRKHRAGEDTPWFAGQIIMIARNDYTLEVFNGDIGLIMPDAESANGLAAYFPNADGFKKIAISRLPQFDSAFAMTVHKSQGSEYREVWLLLPSGKIEQGGDDALSGLNNALLYTAITRARERFVFWGNEEQWRLAVETRKTRRTALGEILDAMFVPKA